MPLSLFETISCFGINANSMPDSTADLNQQPSGTETQAFLLLELPFLKLSTNQLCFRNRT